MRIKGSNSEIKKEEHPEWYYHIPDMRTLILGTFPPYKDKRDFEFYYPNNQNRFWNVLAKIENCTLKAHEGQDAVEERKKLMKELKVGVQNIGKIINRKGESSLDIDIEILEFQDLLDIINKSEKLEAILLAGYSGKNSTYQSFIRYLKINDIKHNAPKKPIAGCEFSIQCKRPIRCIVGNSTSRSAVRAGVSFEMLIEQFKKAIRQ